MNDIVPREIKVRRCLCDLNPRGWICVSEAVRMLKRARARLEFVDIGNNTAVFSLFPKQRPWYFGALCDKGLLSAVFQAALEFVFDVDLVVSVNHLLVFNDVRTGMEYEVTDKWFDYWFVVASEDTTESICSESTVQDVGESFAWHDELFV